MINTEGINRRSINLGRRFMLGSGWKESGTVILCGMKRYPETKESDWFFYQIYSIFGLRVEPVNFFGRIMFHVLYFIIKNLRIIKPAII